MLGWLIGILIFIASWLLCFIFTYKVYYWDITKDGDSMSEDERKSGMFWASLHLFGAFIAVMVLCFSFPKIYEDKVVNGNSYFGKIIRKLVDKLEK